MARRSDFGTIRKLPSGRYQARYRDGAGMLRPAPTTFATRAGASRFLAAVRTDLERGIWNDPRLGREPLAEYAVDWVEARRVRGRPLAPRTKELYLWQLDRYILPSLGATSIARITSQDVASWFKSLSADGGPGASTAAKCYRLLHAIFATAVRDGVIGKTPCVVVGAGTERSAHRPSITPDQVFTLADEVGPRWRCMVLLAGFCGLRIGELAALRRTHIDLDSCVVHIAAAVSETRSFGLVTVDPKSEAGRRSVAVPRRLVDELSAHLAQYADAGPNGLVFIGPKGGPLRQANFGKSIWRPAVRRAGLEGIHFHDLRATAATLAAISGATTAELMRRLGHATPDVAMRYQRATAERDRAIAQRVDTILGGELIPLRRDQTA